MLCAEAQRRVGGNSDWHMHEVVCTAHPPSHWDSWLPNSERARANRGMTDQRTRTGKPIHWHFKGRAVSQPELPSLTKLFTFTFTYF